MFKRVILFLFFIVGNLTFSNAQFYLEHETEQADSTGLYSNDIYESLQQNGWFRHIYSLIFRNPQPEDSDQENLPKTEEVRPSFEGKIIREIFVVHKTPSNIEAPDDSDIETIRNRISDYLHVNTRAFAVRNLLLFSEKDRFDSLRIKESERLIRAQRYIDHGSIEVVPIAGSTDSIDIRVRVRDAFSIIPEGHISPSRFGVGLRNINLFGWGHQVRGFYTWNRDAELHNYMYAYNIPNIFNTHINANVVYRHSPMDSTETKQLSFQRPFYSFFTRWAGGIELTQQSERSNVFLPGIVEPVSQRLQYNEQDYWAAYALKLSKRENQSFILSARYYRIDYTRKPLPEFDPLRIYTRENLYLLGIGFSERKYKHDRYLRKFGFIEDVPEGQAYNIVGGIQNKNGLNRLYLGTSLSRGQYIKWGYIEGLVEFGSFLDNVNVQEGVFRGEINYFSPLIKISGWKIRQFFSPQLILGINRLPIDRVTLNDYFDISGFSSIRPFGTQKIVTHLQTNIYTPYNLWGFRIGAYLSYSMGMLGDNRYRFSHNRAYSAFGPGLMFRNDRLVFNSFKVGVLYFPYVPGEGYGIFKFNLHEPQSFRYHDFDINKPDMVRYR